MLNNFWWITESFLEFKELISENNIKCNWKKNLSTVFCKFAEEKALMVEFNIAYIAKWYFGSDYVNCK